MIEIGFLLGWPAVVAALLVSMAGAWRKIAAPIWLGAALVLPISIYLSTTPRFFLAGVIPLAGLAYAALRCRHTARWHSLAGVGIATIFFAWLAWLVVNDPSA